VSFRVIARSVARMVSLKRRPVSPQGSALAPARVTAHISAETIMPGAHTLTTFDDRENAFENKYAHDAEMQFKADARRNKLLGLWAADLMGKTGDDAQAYAREVVKADFEEAGDEDVYRKVAGDLGDKADETTIRTKMIQLMAEAKAQLMKEE
jgi:hypothetical protein